MSGEEAPTPPQQQPEQEKMPDEEPPPADSETPQETGSSSSSPSNSSSSPASGEEEKPVTCRALVLSGYGGYDKVKLLQVKPLKTKQQQLEAGEVIVNIKACGLNFADLMGKQGLYELLPAPPVIMGMEGSGVIQAVGEDVKDRKVGDRVIVLSRSGTWQEVVVMPANRTFPMPEQMSFEEGAAIPVNYLTAYMMLFDIANVRPGKSVLIHMAAGGVGTAVTQLCRTVPDVTVFGTASPSKHETIAQGGVTHPIDYRTKDYVEEIRKISPKGVDIVLDPLGGSDTQKGYSLLKPMGTLVSFGVANCVTGQKKNLLAMAKTWAYQFSLTMLKLMQANKAVGGFHLGYITDEQLIGRTMSKLLELYEQGKIKPRIDSCYHFEEVTDAMKRMHERLNIGKVILLTEAKKVEEKPKSEPEKSESEPEPVQNVEEPEDATNEEEEEETEEEEPTEEVKAED